MDQNFTADFILQRQELKFTITYRFLLHFWPFSGLDSSAARRDRRNAVI